MVLVFDYDGTLHNTAGLYGKAFRKGYKWLVDGGYAEDVYRSDEEMSKYLGMNPLDMWKAFMPDLPEDVRAHASAMVGEGMSYGVEHGDAVLFDHVPEVLQELKDEGHMLAILSNCRNSYMAAHRKAFRLEQWFDGFFPAQEYDYIPKEDIFKVIMKRYPGEKYVMIGDRASDIKAGTENGITTIGCSYGFADPGELDDASYIISDITELPELVRKIQEDLE